MRVSLGWLIALAAALAAIVCGCVLAFGHPTDPTSFTAAGIIASGVGLILAFVGTRWP